MANRPPRPKGAPWIIPYLTVRNAEATLDFYQRAFGFEKKDVMLNPEGQIMHAEMTWQDGMIMFAPEGAWGSESKTPASSQTQCPVGLYVYCEDVDALFAKAKEEGAEVASELETMFWGDRMCRLIDHEGYIWSFATNVADFDPSKVPH